MLARATSPLIPLPHYSQKSVGKPWFSHLLQVAPMLTAEVPAGCSLGLYQNLRLPGPLSWVRSIHSVFCLQQTPPHPSSNAYRTAPNLLLKSRLQALAKSHSAWPIRHSCRILPHRMCCPLGTIAQTGLGSEARLPAHRPLYEVGL